MIDQLEALQDHPFIEKGRYVYAMFADFQENDWVMPLIEYVDKDHLVELLAEEIIEPAENLCKERQKCLEQIFKKKRIQVDFRTLLYEGRLVHTY